MIGGASEKTKFGICKHLPASFPPTLRHFIFVLHTPTTGTVAQPPRPCFFAPTSTQHKLPILALFPKQQHYPPIMPFAQLVIGPPGAGKSTYCHGMHQFLGAIGRKSSIVNLDPANDPISASYTPALDIRDLISLENIMADEEIALGPNGGVLYALEELERDLDDQDSWFEKSLKNLGEDYVLFDCPGQVEIFTHHDSLRRVVGRLGKLGYRVCVLPEFLLRGSYA
jgi:hypothetical protein